MLPRLTLLLLHASLALASPSHHRSPLHWDVFLNPAQPVYDPPNNYSFSPTAFTLLHGRNTAILVDAPVNIASSNALADWIQETIPHKRLTHVFITHGHGDHFFGVPILQKRFPGLKAIATKDSIIHIHQQLTPDVFNTYWRPFFGDQIPPQTETFSPLPRSGEFFLEGHVLKAVEVGQTDTSNSTVLHVPDLDLVVAGDAVYGECFQYLAEDNTVSLQKSWIKAISKIQKLKPRIVVPSHKQEWDGFGIDHLEKTKEFLEVWGREVKVAKNKEDLKSRIKKRYPHRIGDFILDISATAAFPPSSG